MRRMRWTAPAAVLTAAVLVASGCGWKLGRHRRWRRPRRTPTPRRPGRCSFFAYGDTVTDRLLDPFREAEPRPRPEDRELRLEQGGGGEARRRLRGRRGRGLRRRDAAAARCAGCSGRSTRGGSPASTTCAFSDCARGPRRGRQRPVRARLGRAAGADRQHRRDRPEPIDSCNDLFDAAYAGRRGDGGDAADGDRRGGAGARAWTTRWTSAPTRSRRSSSTCSTTATSSATFAESDASMVNLFKSGEAVIADGGRGTTADDGRRRRAGRVDRAEGGGAVVGLRPRDHVERPEHRRRLQADQLLRLARRRRRSPATRGSWS